MRKKSNKNLGCSKTIILFIILIAFSLFIGCTSTQTTQIIEEQKQPPLIEQQPIISENNVPINETKKSDIEQPANIRVEMSTPKEFATVKIIEEGFSPKNLTIQKGSKVIWVNEQLRKRKLALDNGEFIGWLVNKGDKVEWVFYKEGIYHYSDMTNQRYSGTIIVTK